MSRSKKAVFTSGYDGFGSVLSVVNEINSPEVDLHLYTYDLNIIPNFFINEFSSVNKIPQLFYTRNYKNNSEKIIDRFNFAKLFLRSLFRGLKKKKYDELHFLGYLNNPSFLIYENIYKNSKCLSFHYKIPTSDFFKPNKKKQDWKLRLLSKLFLKKIMYYDYPPKKTAIGLSEKHLSSYKMISWEKLRKHYKISADYLGVDLSKKNRVLILGTRFEGSLEKVDCEKTLQKVTDAVLNKFPNYVIYYKPHYRADFDLTIPGMKILEKYLPAEFIIPYFKIVCGYDSTTFNYCSPKMRMISFMKLIAYYKNDGEKDMQIFRNVCGEENFKLIEFLT